MCGALSDERTGLSFTIAAGPSQRSHSRVRAPSDSRPYLTVSDLRLPISSPPTTRKARVEVFNPASTRATRLVDVGCFCNFVAHRIEDTIRNNSFAILCLFVVAEMFVNFVATLWFLQAYPLLRIRVLPSRCLAMDHSNFQATCHITNGSDERGTSSLSTEHNFNTLRRERLHPRSLIHSWS
jgi:hypothetical protein